MKVALYARVSSKTQEKAGTIASQVAALRSHASQAGHTICEEFVCRDDGVSGASLDRRGLDRLRDGAEAGLFDAVLVLSPDRLSRKYAYLILIVEEFERLGVPIVFLEQPPADDPHSCLLMQIQGAVAEYERAKLAERYRRGKLHRARQGEVWWTGVPLGYRHIPRRDGVPPHVVIDEDHAAVVRRIFEWHANEGMTVRQIAKRLTLSGPRPPRGGGGWGETTIHKILHNEAYIGTLYYNRRQQLAVTGAEAASAGRTGVVRSRLRPESEWISISIPPIVDQDTFQRSQERHAPNRQFSPRRLKEERWLLRRLLRCGKCGRKHACVSDAKRPGGERRYYYRCGKAADFSGRPRCRPSHVRSEPLDQLVWQQIREHLLHPQLLLRAQKQLGGPAGDHAFFSEQLQATERRLRQAQAQRRRLVDAFQAGFLRREEFEERAGALAERIRGLEGDHQGLEQEQQKTLVGGEFLGRLQEFTTTVAGNLDTLGFEQRQKLARLLLEEIVLDDSDVHIYFKIPLPKPPFDPSGRGPTSKVSRGFGLRSQSDDDV